MSYQAPLSDDEGRAVKLLQGYIWHPKDLELDLADYLPRRLEPDLHLLWDEIRPPFTFFDDGTLAATQRIYQFTVLTQVQADTDEPQALVPWLAETLQVRLETTPPGVGWQIFEDMRDV